VIDPLKTNRSGESLARSSIWITRNGRHRPREPRPPELTSGRFPARGSWLLRGPTVAGPMSSKSRQTDIA
jgi:hypothetical protein